MPVPLDSEYLSFFEDPYYPNPTLSTYEGKHPKITTIFY
jgi:hypothetical protein